MKFLLLKYKIYFLFLLISFAWLVTTVGFNNISFQSTEWLYQGNDSELPQMGWYFFRNDIWRFPLGSNPNYGTNYGSSIVFADSIPILSIIFKLFKSYLPVNFQYISFWYFICFFLQLLFSYKILEKFTNSTTYSFIGSIFFLITPILLYKFQAVPALTGHWVLLFSLYLGLNKDLTKNKLSWIFIIILSCLVNFYFMIMVLGTYSILRILTLKFNKKEIFYFIKDFLIIFILLVLVLYTIGYFQIRIADTMALGFARDKLNLLSIFDPNNSNSAVNGSWSLFLPDIKLTQGEEGEGFNFLGTGQILLLFSAILLFFTKKKKKNLQNIKSNKEIKNLIITSAFFTLWALSTKISFGAYTIIDIPLNKYVYGLFSVVRPTGRLFWIVSYFLLILSLIILFKCFSKKISVSIITIFLLIQIVDTSQAIKNRIDFFNPIDKTRHPKDLLWGKLFTNYKILKTTYPKNYTTNFSTFAYLTEFYNIKKTNLVKLARIDRKAIADARYDLYKQLLNKNLSDDTVYIVENLGHLRHLKKIYKNSEVGFFYRDNVWSMVLNEKDLMSNNDKNKFKKIKPKLLELDKIYNINFKDRNSFLGLGWTHNKGKQGTWSDGEISTLLFEINQKSKDLKLEIISDIFNGSKESIFEFEIYINDSFYKKVKLFDNKKFEILLKKEFINNDEIVIGFKFKDLSSPYELMESPDARKLGILIKQIKLTTF